MVPLALCCYYLFFFFFLLFFLFFSIFFFLMIRRPPRSTLSSSSAASDVYKRQFVDKTVEDTKGHFPVLYEQLKRYSIIFKAAYGFTFLDEHLSCLLYTSPSPRDGLLSRMPSSA